VHEPGVVEPGLVVVSVVAAYFRPAEVDSLVGDAAKAREKLGWHPRIDFDALVDEMADADLALAKREQMTGKGRMVPW
jgi:GDPmannose 4,6-dehydratase